MTESVPAENEAGPHSLSCHCPELKAARAPVPAGSCASAYLTSVCLTTSPQRTEDLSLLAPVTTQNTFVGRWQFCLIFSARMRSPWLSRWDVVSSRGESWHRSRRLRAGLLMHLQCDSARRTSGACDKLFLIVKKI